MKTLIVVVVWTLLLLVAITHFSQAHEYYVPGIRPLFILPHNGEEGDTSDSVSPFDSLVHEDGRRVDISEEISSEQDDDDDQIRTASKFGARDELRTSETFSSDGSAASEVKKYAKELAEMLRANEHRQQQYLTRPKSDPFYFSNMVHRTREFSSRPQRPYVHANPATYHRTDFEDEDEEEEDENSEVDVDGRPRILWPFSFSVSTTKDGEDKISSEDGSSKRRIHWPFLSITKTVGGGDEKSEGHNSGYFDHYPIDYTHEFGQQGQGYNGWDLTTPFQGLSEEDLDILHSKGFKKYKKKKKKVIKKLEKALKLKRILQKILEKKIHKIDKNLNN